MPTLKLVSIDPRPHRLQLSPTCLTRVAIKSRASADIQKICRCKGSGVYSTHRARQRETVAPDAFGTCAHRIPDLQNTVVQGHKRTQKPVLRFNTLP